MIDAPCVPVVVKRASLTLTAVDVVLETPHSRRAQPLLATAYTDMRGRVVEPAPAFDQPVSPVVGTVLAIAAVLILLFFVYPAPLADSAAAAAATLFTG